MGIGKRGIGILCGVLLCIMLALVLHNGKQAEKAGESIEPEVFEGQVPEEGDTYTPSVTQEQETMETNEPKEIQEVEETQAPQEESTFAPTQPPIPMETKAPEPMPTATPTPLITATPIPTITPSPIPVVIETEAPKVVITPYPTESPTPTPEVPETKEEHVHEFEMSVWELPTCQKSGYYNNVCKSCGVVECVTQEPIPHEVEDILIQEGNCMEDTVIRHICKMCEQQVKIDTRYTVYDKHLWSKEWVDGVEVEYCEWCGVVK